MIDKFGRNITYLRLSVTELCNLRCRYCMPADGVCKKSHTEMLTEDEMIDVVKAAASFGITKVRITGGEPLLQIDFLLELFGLAKEKGIHTCLDTSGVTYRPGESSYNEKLDALFSVKGFWLLIRSFALMGVGADMSSIRIRGSGWTMFSGVVLMLFAIIIASIVFVAMVMIITAN